MFPRLITTPSNTHGLNWYPNYWVKYMVNVAVDQLKEPSTIGAVPQNYYVVCSASVRF